MSITLDTKLKPAELFSLYQEHYLGLKKLFDELSQTRVMELLRYNQERAKYLLNYHCKVIACPASHLILNNEMLLDSKFKVGTIIVMEAGQISDFETFSAILSSKGLERVVMIGDQKQSAPVVLNSTLETTARLSCSMFSRLLSLGHKSVKLTHQGKARPDIYDCLRWNYSEVLDLARVTEDSIYKAECPGLKHHCQIIDIQSQEVI